MQQPVNASVLAAVESDPQISPTRRLRIGLLYKHRERAMLLGHQAEAAITGRAELGLSGCAQSSPSRGARSYAKLGVFCFPVSILTQPSRVARCWASPAVRSSPTRRARSSFRPAAERRHLGPRRSYCASRPAAECSQLEPRRVAKQSHSESTLCFPASSPTQPSRAVRTVPFGERAVHPPRCGMQIHVS
jgi:hypothetical protein